MRFLSGFALAPLLALVTACAHVSLTGMSSGSPSPVTSSSPSGKTSLDPSTPACPDANVTCLTDRLCSFDTKLGCMRCACAPALGAAPDVGGVPPVQ